MIIFIFLVAVGPLRVSYIRVSYIKVRAEGLGVEREAGLLACPKRVVILAIGLLSHTGIWALALLAVLMHRAAVEGMFTVWQEIRKAPEGHNAAKHNAYKISTDNHH